MISPLITADGNGRLVQDAMRPPISEFFNPYLQTKKFDPQLLYIKKWVPEFESLQYTQPIVQHEVARKRCLEVYASALK